MNQANLDGWIGESVQVSLDLQFAIYVNFQRRRMRPSRRQAHGQNERINSLHPIWDGLVQQAIKVHWRSGDLSADGWQQTRTGLSPRLFPQARMGTG
jgi:hypothetical protein